MDIHITTISQVNLNQESNLEYQTEESNLEYQTEYNLVIQDNNNQVFIPKRKNQKFHMIKNPKKHTRL